MAVVDDSDAVSRFEAALAAHRRLNAREDALADAQRAALERAESHDLAPPTPPVQASELQQLLDDPKSDQGKIMKIVDKDPILVAQIMKVSNSALNRRQGQSG